MTTPKNHPSGRPIRRPEQKRLPIWRIPDDGYISPRLKKYVNTTAIGFPVTKTEPEEEEQD